MKPKNIFRAITSVMIIFMLSLILPSCATTRAKKIDTQKRGLMLQDKSQYTKNKGKWKGSKAHKSQKKRMKRSGRMR